ncbi:MAG: LL-diaminopimelate aminotransferase [Coriobacteriia bacterium]|nr:LL-diaminopimelate aminotransferase [Coriobacteriia bacterium]MCL2536890.1 LL-diaminopimelate aminotransferase [Coriobacteriia bacterium]
MTKFAAKRLDNLPPYLFAEIDRKRDALLAEGKDVISLGIGDPDKPTFKHVIDEMIEAVKRPANHQYPSYAGSLPYRKACAQFMKTRFGVDVDPVTETLALIGSKEGIANLFPAFVDPGSYTLIPGVGYPVYSGGGILNDSQSWWMPMNEDNGFLADFESTPVEVLEKAQMMILSYPNNPTSAVATPEYFDAAIAFAKKHDLLLVHDNAYCDIAFDGYVPPSILERPGAMDCCIEILSASKSYNMTGWRAAFAVGNADAISTLGVVKSNVDSGIFTAVQEAAAKAFTGPQDEVKKMSDLYERRRNIAMKALDEMGMEYLHPKSTIFMWVKVPDGYTSEEYVTKILEEAHVIVAPGNAYGPQDGEGYFRISLACDDKRIAEAFDRIKNMKA